MRLLLVIIAHKFAWTIKDIVDGLTHRYCGLYANLCRLVLRYGGRAFWYSVKDRVLIKLPENVKAPKCSMFRSLITMVLDSALHRMFMVIVLDYPHSFLGVRHLLDYLASLLLLHLVRLLNRGYVIVDIMDPPIEHAYELRGNIKLGERVLWILLNKIVFSFNLILFPTCSYRVYHKLRYGLKYEKTVVISHGSFPEEISYSEPFAPPPLKILYSGNITKWNNTDRLVAIIRELSREGFDAELIVTGEDHVGIESDDLKLMRNLPFSKYGKLLSEAHVFVIPYPKTLHHLLTMRAKLPDYMMAGRPILFTKSLGMNEAVALARCGFAFEDFKELKALLIQLYGNRDLVKVLGRRARSFAEKHMVYMEHARKLLMEILSRLSQVSKQGL